MPASIPIDLARRLTQRNIIRSIGAGTFGETFEVNDAAGHHAIKILDPTVQDVRRTAREIAALKAVTCNRVVKLIDEQTRPDGNIDYTYLTCEFLDGPTLDQNLAQYQDPARLRVLIEELATGLVALREKKLTHRDLKPQNIICATHGGVIIDLGIAKFHGGTTLTLPGQPVGTFAYMSPEQIRGETWVDSRSDIFALGIIGYQCLLGQHPFSSSQDLIQALLTEAMPTLSASAPWVQTLLPRMCEKAAYDRPRTPQMLLNELASLP